MVIHQLQVERRTGKVRQSKTDVRPLGHATNLNVRSVIFNREMVGGQARVTTDKEWVLSGG